MACLACMLRTKGTLGVAQNKPTSMPLTPNCTPWAATAKTTGAKGTYLKKVSLASTMGPGVKLDPATALTT